MLDEQRPTRPTMRRDPTKSEQVRVRGAFWSKLLELAGIHLPPCRKKTSGSTEEAL